jgi:hypothetical protein
MLPIRQGLEKDAPEAIEYGLLERAGLEEAITVLSVYVAEIYKNSECPAGLKMAIDKLRDKLSLVEGHLRHYRALVEAEDYVAPVSETANPPQPQGADISKD